MSATKQIALGTVIGVDVANGTSYVTVTLVMDATPPGRKRVLIDQTALSDTLATNAGGVEDHSQFAFTQYWTPGDTMHETLDTAFAATPPTTCAWKATYPFGTPVADSFHGWISELGPQTLTKDGMITRKVTVERTSGITRA